MKRKLGSIRILASLFVLGAVLSGQARAWDGITAGHVGGIQVYADGSGFQFSLAGQPNLCPTSGWPHHGSVMLLDTGSSDGVKIMLDTLTRAKIYGYTVRVYANNNAPTSNQGCTVGSIDLDLDI
jgi:hypothetical protein